LYPDPDLDPLVTGANLALRQNVTACEKKLIDGLKRGKYVLCRNLVQQQVPVSLNK
jgi:hypothetical protein